jgi:hypothetical protein
VASSRGIKCENMRPTFGSRVIALLLPMVISPAGHAAGADHPDAKF